MQTANSAIGKLEIKPGENLTPEQRLRASIALEPVDRLVCAPFLYAYAANFAGVTQRQFLNDFDLGMQCFDKVKAAYPVWDANRSNYGAMACGPMLRNFWFQKVALPGEELGENESFQIVESELASQEELLAVKTKGVGFYMRCVGKRVRPKAGLIHFLLWKFRRKALMRKELRSTVARGQSLYYGGTAAIGYELFSMTRSMALFTRDMYKLGDKLVEILWVAQAGAVQMAISECRSTGIPRAFVVGCRCTPTFLNKKNFDRFSWPFLKKAAQDLIAAGITPVFHLDTDWGRGLEYFLELPRGKCIVETDGATDLFRAKEILRDHVCLSGDVPPAMLTIGSPSEVEDYCKRLIQEVGKGGGYIFSNGCTMPPNSRHENVKAMFSAVVKYGRYN